MRWIPRVLLLCTSLFVQQGWSQSKLRKQLTQGIEFMHAGNYVSAYSTLTSGAQRSEQLDSLELQVLFSNNLGALYFYLDDTDSAMFYYHKALQIAEDHELTSLENTMLNNIGIAYSSMGLNKEALNTLNRALALSILDNDSAKIAINNANLAQINLSLGNTNSALNHAEVTLLQYASFMDSLTAFSALNTLAQVYGVMHEPELALAQADMALKLADSLQNRDWLITVWLQKGMLFMENGTLDSAQIALLKAWEMAGSRANLAQQISIKQALADVRMMQGRYDSAVHDLQEVLALKDAVLAQNNAGFIERNKLRFDLYMQQSELQHAQIQHQNRVIFTTLIVGILLLVIGLLMVILWQRRKVNVLKQAQLESEKRLMAKELTVAQAHTSELEEQLASINYELMSKSLLLDNKNAVLSAVSELVNGEEATSSSYVHNLRNELSRNKIVDQNHDEFSVYFERVHAHFFKNLHAQHQGLNAADLRLAAFFLLQFNTKEIANILHISP